MGRDGEGSFRNFESGGGEDNRRAVRQSFVSQEEKYFWAVVTFSSYVRVNPLYTKLIIWEEKNLSSHFKQWY